MNWRDYFSAEFTDALTKGLASRQEEERTVAAFDADGTLWDRDFGEAFLRWLIAARKLKNVDYGTDIFARYEEMIEEDRDGAYLHVVTIMEGLAAADVSAWSSWLASAWPNYRPGMRQLVEHLQEVGVETWIVSASNGWSIKAAAPFMGFSEEMALGIMTAEKDGLITSKPLHPITTGAGKVEALHDVIKARPLFAFGDSMGDFEMLEEAVYPMVVGEHRHSTAELIQVARSREWPVTLF